MYANTLYEPLDAFYHDPQWGTSPTGGPSWRRYYDQAKRMLGVVENPTMTPADEVMQRVAEEMGVGDTFRLHAGRRVLRRDGRRSPASRSTTRTSAAPGPGARGLHRGAARA